MYLRIPDFRKTIFKCNFSITLAYGTMGGWLGGRTGLNKKRVGREEVSIKTGEKE
jgi:hypothetical protein